MVQIKEETFNEIRKLPIHHASDFDKGGARVKFLLPDGSYVLIGMTIKELEKYFPHIAINIHKPGQFIKTTVKIIEG